MNDKEDLREGIDEILSIFSLLDEDVLIYKRPANMTPLQIMQILFVGARMILKYRCRNVICEINEFAPSIGTSKVKNLLRKRLARAFSPLDCVVFVVEDPLKMKDSEWIAKEIELSCQIVWVKTFEEAIEFLQYVEPDYHI